MLLNLCWIHIRVVQPIKKKTHANFSKWQFTWKHKLNLDTCIVRLIGSAARKNKFHFMVVFAYESTGRLFLCSTVSASSLLKFWHSQCSSSFWTSTETGQDSWDGVSVSSSAAGRARHNIRVWQPHGLQKQANSAFLPLLFFWCDFERLELGATSKGCCIVALLQESGNRHSQVVRNEQCQAAQLRECQVTHPDLHCVARSSASYYS